MRTLFYTIDKLDKPILVENSIYEYIKNNKSNSIEDVCLAIFKEPIGNPDILINTINSYSDLISITKEKRCFIKEGAEKMEVMNSRNDKKAFFEYFNENDNANNPVLPFPHNRILFGAPGTGKSHKLNEEAEKNFGKNYERVTFHPNYSFAQFVGSYKPVTNEDGEISYEYTPGPFMRVYVNAIKNPGKNFLLLIEEINRANVAAVFGDVFQLLDRYGESGDENGNYALCSEYPVNVSEDIRKFFASKGINDTEMRIPSNMYIWATMNSADQGVMPMDAAFKRRWDFEYIGIDENQTWEYTIPIPKDNSVNWNSLRHAINDKLKTISGVNEDKLLGPYFISKSVLDKFGKGKTPSDDEKNDFIKTFESKVLMYLFEDVCKMRPADLFSGIKMPDGQTRLHYSDICAAFNSDGIGIFGFTKDQLDSLEKQLNPSKESSTQQAADATN